MTKSGRYGGGIYAHMDIALEFASWLSPEFKLYIIKDYKRLKYNENSHLSLGWNLNREIAKLNYRIHTDAIKENLIPPELTSEQIGFTYANEADLLNVVLFGMAAKAWRDNNADKKGNIRDYANLNQLLVLANMESNPEQSGHMKTMILMTRCDKYDKQGTLDADESADVGKNEYCSQRRAVNGKQGTDY